MSTSEELQSGEYEAHDGGFKPLTPEDVVEIEKEYGASLGPNFLTNSPQEQKKILGLMEQLHGKNGKWTEYLADSKVLLAKA
ncbi:hypothetical protein KKG71_06835, partial [Patescibacteria group bacterium]|nr:hypothetical protein [Patescibacteria group bacterium]